MSNGLNDNGESKLYDRRADEVTLDDVERIIIWPNVSFFAIAVKRMANWDPREPTLSFVPSRKMRPFGFALSNGHQRRIVRLADCAQR